MKQLILVFTILMASLALSGQQLYTDKGKLMEEAPYFNSSFIQAKKVRSIVAKVSYKDEMMPIRKTAKQQRYYFDRWGRLIKYTENYFRAGIYDSSYVEYIYSRSNLLTRKTVKDVFGMHLYTYQHNEKGDVVEAIHTRPTNRRIPAKKKTFKYEYYGDRQSKKLHLNDEGRIFRIENINKTLKGKTDEINSKYVTARKREFKDFIYDNNGYLVRMVHQSQNSPVITVTFEYKNDATGNPLEQVISRNGKQLSKKEFLYKDGLLYAILNKNEATQRITITELSYSYYP